MKWKSSEFDKSIKIFFHSQFVHIIAKDPNSQLHPSELSSSVRDDAVKSILMIDMEVINPVYISFSDFFLMLSPSILQRGQPLIHQWRSTGDQNQEKVSLSK